MSTHSNIDDDIIELTEIVEDGEPSRFSGDAFLGGDIDFAGLDEELNDPLKNKWPAAPAAEHETPRPGAARQAAAAPNPDLDYLDDMLTSLHPAQPSESTSLDVLLGGDIHLDLPGIPEPPQPEPQSKEKTPTFDTFEQKQEPLSDAFEIRLSGLDPSAVSGKSPFDLSLEDLDLSLPADKSTEHAVPANLAAAPLPEIQQTENEVLPEPEAQGPEENENFKEATTADLEILSARLDVLEGWAAGSEGVAVRRQILAALPENPEDMPFAVTLRTNILEEAGRLIEEKSQAIPTQVAELRRILDAFSARIGILESGLVESEVGAEQVLAALPENPESLPFTATLRTSILEEAGRHLNEEVKALESMVATQAAELRQMLSALAARFESLESQAAKPVHIGAEQVLAALPENPESLPFTATLRTSILEEAGRHLNEEVKALENSTAARIEELRQTLDALTARIETLENRAAEPVHIGAEQVLAALPDNPGDLPFSANLRADILEEMDERVSISVASVDDLFQAMNALEERVTSLNESQERLASMQTSASVQEFEAKLDALRELVRSQEDTLLGLQAALATKETEIAALRENAEHLRRIHEEAIRAQEDSRSALKADLQNFVQEQIPDAAAKIIREEIQNLLRDIGA